MKFFEQSNILDRNHRLVCEGGDEIDLLLAERLHALTGENENADRFIFPQQRHAKRSALTGQRYRFAHRVFGIGSDVGDLHRVAFERHAAGNRASVHGNRVLLQKFDILRREADRSAGPIKVAFAAENEGHLGIA